MFGLTYVFSRKNILQFQFQFFFQFLINFQKVTVTVSKTVTMSFEVNQSSGGLSTYMENTKKKLERKSQCQIIHGGPVILCHVKSGILQKCQK